MSDIPADELEKEVQGGPEATEVDQAAQEVSSGPDPLEVLKAENEQLKDQLLRKTADFDNYRKRMIREKEEMAKYANSNLLTDLMGVLDDFERAIQSAGTARDFDSFHSGIVMIEQQFVSMLEKKYNLIRFASLGQPFSHDRHEAIAMDPVEDGQESHVVAEFQKGYTLYDRVLRPAKVKVGPKIANNSTGSNTESEQGASNG